MPTDTVGVNDAPTFGAPVLSLVSTTASGTAGNGTGWGEAHFSPDGHRVAFVAASTNLQAGDTNGAWDVFVKNLATGELITISLAPDGSIGDDYSSTAIFSPDGSKLYFRSRASNLDPDDTNQYYDIFVKDFATGEISLVSTNAEGTQGSRDVGHFSLSPDGNMIVFTSDATNWLAPDANGSDTDIWVKDLHSGELILVSTSAGGVQADDRALYPSFSPDSSKVVFTSTATNLVEGDTNGVGDIFVKDILTGAITRISTAADGSEANGTCAAPIFSADGTKIAFLSNATNLVAGAGGTWYQLYVKDLVTGAVTCVSTSLSGTVGNFDSFSPMSFSPDGTKILFSSSSTNLVEGDTNGATDIFMKDLVTGAVTRVSAGEDGSQANGSSGRAAFSADGSSIVFTTLSTSLGGSGGVYVTTPGNGDITFIEGDGPLQLVGRAEVGDVDSAFYDGGSLTVAITAGAAPGDVLSLAPTLTLHGTTLYYRGAAVGTLTATATSLTIVFGTWVDDEVVKTMVEAVRLSNPTNDPGSALRTITFTLVDGGGTADGGSDTASFTREVAFIAVAPIESSLSHVLDDRYFDLTLTGADATDGTGNARDNILLGNDAANRLYGLAGNDRIDGGLGADRMAGGEGDDLYIVDVAQDAVVEAADGGTDTIVSAITRSLNAHVENLTLAGGAHVNAFGNDLANILTGNDGNNVLNGRAGADVMRGGAGNDSYVVDDAGDVVEESDAAHGRDTVTAWIDYVLPDHVEQLRLAGTALSGTGNDLANSLTGNGLDNRLDGGAGADTMRGGLGNDVYIVDHSGDAAIESAGQGDADTVYASATYRLRAHVEALVLTGEAAIDGTGNAGANRITGNDAGNVLNGLAGADLLEGMGGDDLYVVDDVADMAVEASALGGYDRVQSSASSFTLGDHIEELRLVGTAVGGTGNGLANRITGNGGANVLSGGGGDDLISAGAGADILSGGLGADRLYGGGGADQFRFDSVLDGQADRLSDMVAGFDEILLDRSIFTGLAADGVLDASAFAAGTAAADADDRIIYDQATGRIWYDSDGTGAEAAILFAQVPATAALTHLDFTAYTPA